MAPKSTKMAPLGSQEAPWESHGPHHMCLTMVTAVQKSPNGDHGPCLGIPMALNFGQFWLPMVRRGPLCPKNGAPFDFKRFSLFLFQIFRHWGPPWAPTLQFLTPTLQLLTPTLQFLTPTLHAVAPMARQVRPS